MDRIEKERYRLVTQCHILDMKTYEDFQVNSDTVYKFYARLMITIRHWYSKFKRGQISIFYEKRLDRLIKKKV